MEGANLTDQSACRPSSKQANGPFYLSPEEDDALNDLRSGEDEAALLPTTLVVWVPPFISLLYCFFWHPMAPPHGTPIKQL